MIQEKLSVFRKEWGVFISGAGGYYLNLLSNYLYSFIFGILGARYLGVESWGVVIFYTSATTVISLIVEYGAGVYGMREASNNKENPNSLLVVWNEIHILKPTLMMMGVSIFALLIFFSGKNEYLIGWVFFSIVMGISTGLNSSWFLQATNSFSRYALVDFVVKLIASFVLFCIYQFFPQSLIVFGFSAMIPLATCLVAFYHSKSILLKSQDQRIVKDFKKPLPEFLMRVSIMGFVQLNGVTLGLLGTYQDVGIFSSSEKLSRALLSILIPMSTYFFVKLCQTKADQVERVYRLSFWFIFGGALFISVLSFLFSVPLTQLFFGFESPKIEPVFKVLIWIVPASSLNYCWGMNYWVQIGKTHIFTVISGLSSLLCLGIAFLLVQEWGVWGMTIAVLAGEWFTACCLGSLKLILSRKIYAHK